MINDTSDEGMLIVKLVVGMALLSFTEQHGKILHEYEMLRGFRLSYPQMFLYFFYGELMSL
jgi:hypothetical protein